MSGGLKLGGFLSHKPDVGGGAWLSAWKERPGFVELWLHTKADFFFHWHHSFVAPDVVEDRQAGQSRKILRFPRFTCWEPEKVNASQYFVNDQNTGRKLPPTSCPFCLLRDWLRWGREAQAIPLDRVIFRWERPPTDRGRSQGPIEWRRGYLSGLEKKGSNWDETIDAKLRYLFVVVPQPAPDAQGELAAVIAEATKGLGEKMKTLIADEIRSKGDEDGNPLVRPYCIRWEYNDKEQNPQAKYKALRWDRNRLTAAIRDAITSEDFPNVTPHVTCDAAEDGPKIRSLMEIGADNAGMRDMLPWDLLFPRRARQASTESTLGDARKIAPTAPAQSAPATAQAAAPAGLPPKRRRLVEEAPPPPPPEPERIPCDRCGHPMLPTESVCAKCGAKYVVDADDDVLVGHRDAAQNQPAQPSDGGVDCWQCGASRPPTGEPCPHCNAAADDDIPF